MVNRAKIEEHLKRGDKVTWVLEEGGTNKRYTGIIENFYTGADGYSEASVRMVDSSLVWVDVTILTKL